VAAGMTERVTSSRQDSLGAVRHAPFPEDADQRRWQLDSDAIATAEKALEHLTRASQLVASLHDRYLDEQALSKIAEATGALRTRTYEMQAQRGEARWPPEPETYW
jgi:hypothetical protein